MEILKAVPNGLLATSSFTQTISLCRKYVTQLASSFRYFRTATEVVFFRLEIVFKEKKLQKGLDGLFLQAEFIFTSSEWLEKSILHINDMPSLLSGCCCFLQDL